METIAFLFEHKEREREKVDIRHDTRNETEKKNRLENFTFLSYNACWELPEVEMLHSARRYKRLLRVVKHVCQSILHKYAKTQNKCVDSELIFFYFTFSYFVNIITATTHVARAWSLL